VTHLHGVTIYTWSARANLTQATVIECEVPVASTLDRHQVADAYFKDAYRAPLRNPNAGVIALFAAVFAHHPLWIKGLLLARNAVASRFGLVVPKPSDILNPVIKETYQAGEKIGPWPLFFISETELIAGQDNGHLDFRLSVLRQKHGADSEVVVSTICNTHNRWGKIYLFFIVPFHKWGVKRLIADAIAAGRL
jgi:hypothetical protein